MWPHLLGRLRKENHLNLGCGACNEARWCHCIPAGVTEAERREGGREERGKEGKMGGREEERKKKKRERETKKGRD